MVCLDKEVLPKSITAKKLNAKICDDVKSIMRLTLILGRSSPWKFSLYYSITIIANFLRLFIYLNSDIMTVAYCVICNFPVFWQLSICYFRPNYIRVPYSLPYFTFTYNLSFSKKALHHFFEILCPYLRKIVISGKKTTSISKSVRNLA